MKPILFANDETDFTTNGLGRLDCISCNVIEERNGMYELEAEIPISGAHASEIEMLSIIGVIPSDGGSLQPFYVYKITKPISGRFKVYGRHISYRLSDIPCNPFSVESGPSACASTLSGLKNNAIEFCPFNFSTDITTPAAYTQKTPASIRQRLGGVEGSVIDQFGGEFEWDKFDVKLWKARGRLANVTGITLRYGKNITDLEQEEEIASTATGIVPYWIDADGNNLVMLTQNPKVIYTPTAGNYPYHLTEVLDLSGEYQNKPTEAQIRSAAQAYINKTGFGIPNVSIKVSFVDLWKSEEYKDIAPLEHVKLCDEITVDFSKLGVKATAKVVKTDYDVLKERYNSIEVGNIRTTLAQAVTDREKDIDNEFLQSMVKAAQIVRDATAWLTNSNGYVVAVKNQDGSWKELLFMDTNDTQTAINVLRINTNGIGFSTTGIDGPYTNAWTIDGNLVADFMTTGTLNAANVSVINLNASNINTGTLNANLIKAGIISDLAGKFSLNMTTGALSMADGSFSGTITGSTISGGTISGTTISGNTISGGTISGTTISGSTISGGLISGGSVSGAAISGGSININGQFIVDGYGTMQAPTAYVGYSGNIGFKIFQGNICYGPQSVSDGSTPGICMSTGALRVNGTKSTLIDGGGFSTTGSMYASGNISSGGAMSAGGNVTSGGTIEGASVLCKALSISNLYSTPSDKGYIVTQFGGTYTDLVIHDYTTPRLYTVSGIGQGYVYSAYGPNPVSDRRKKHDIELIDKNKLKRFFEVLEPSQFKYDVLDDSIRYGVIAQNVQEALEESAFDEGVIVSEEATKNTKDDGFLSVAYMEFHGFELAGIKYLYEMVEAQQAEIEALKARIEVLENG